MNDFKYIELILRLVRFENYELNHARDDILNRYSNSKRFNFNNFILGAFVGAMIMLTILSIKI